MKRPHAVPGDTYFHEASASLPTRYIWNEIYSEMQCILGLEGSSLDFFARAIAPDKSCTIIIVLVSNQHKSV